MKNTKIKKALYIICSLVLCFAVLMLTSCDFNLFGSNNSNSNKTQTNTATDVQGNQNNGDNDSYTPDAQTLSAIEVLSDIGTKSARENIFNVTWTDDSNAELVELFEHSGSDGIDAGGSAENRRITLASLKTYAEWSKEYLNSFALGKIADIQKGGSYSFENNKGIVGKVKITKEDNKIVFARLEVYGSLVRNYEVCYYNYNFEQKEYLGFTLMSYDTSISESRVLSYDCNTNKLSTDYVKNLPEAFGSDVEARGTELLNKKADVVFSTKSDTVDNVVSRLVDDMSNAIEYELTGLQDWEKTYINSGIEQMQAATSKAYNMNSNVDKVMDYTYWDSTITDVENINFKFQVVLGDGEITLKIQNGENKSNYAEIKVLFDKQTNAVKSFSYASLRRISEGDQLIIAEYNISTNTYTCQPNVTNKQTINNYISKSNMFAQLDYSK